jgi:hypothetical protein
MHTKFGWKSWREKTTRDLSVDDRIVLKRIKVGLYRLDSSGSLQWSLGFYEHGNEYCGSIKGDEFYLLPEQLSVSPKNSVPWGQLFPASFLFSFIFLRVSLFHIFSFSRSLFFLPACVCGCDAQCRLQTTSHSHGNSFYMNEALSVRLCR